LSGDASNDSKGLRFDYNAAALNASASFGDGNLQAAVSEDPKYRRDRGDANQSSFL
jgi:hypothetical protein